MSNLRRMMMSQIKSDTHEYVDLGLPSGTLWATCNVGASSPEEHGDYFAWGETTTKETYNWSTYKYCNGSSNTITKYCTNKSYGTVDNKTVLESSDDAATVYLGASWHTPTETEIKELIDNCTFTWSNINGINGYVVSGNGNSIFLPCTGVKNGSEIESLSSGFYWSSTLNNQYSTFARSLLSTSTTKALQNIHRYYGRTIRPVMNK